MRKHKGRAKARAKRLVENLVGATRAAGRARKKLVKPHRAVRPWCSKCAKAHTKHEHESHGRGSFKRTH